MPYSQQRQSAEASKAIASSRFPHATSNTLTQDRGPTSRGATIVEGSSGPLNIEDLPIQPRSQQSEPSGRSTIDITVAIPTYNGAQRLPMVLDKLRSQTQLEGVNWEVIVCDNSSTDDTADIVEHYKANWPAHIPLHYRFAAEQGAAFARQRAVESASGELIAFLDDDNLPAQNWLSEAIAFAQSHPEAGAFGSQIHGQFQSELPAELENIKCFLAIIERGDQPHRYEPANKILPPAAGLVVRRSAWLSAVPKRLFLNNKGKEAGLASEDLEALLYIQKAGYDIWYNPAMVVHHDIPDGRLRKDYLVTLFRCVGLSRFHIRLLGLESWKRPAYVPSYIANDICKLALHRLRYGRSEQLDTETACRRTLLASTARSPFFLLKKVCKDTLQDSREKRSGDRAAQLAQITQAFEQNQFTLYQQPVLNVEGQRTAQQELLLRLQTRANTHLLPQDFLPAAQRFHLMRTLDRWVIRNLISRIAKMDNSPEGDVPVYSINLSAQSVQDVSTAQFIAQKLTQANLPAHGFCIEIDSAIANAHPQAVCQLAEELHHIGAFVTLDNIIPGQDTIEQLKHLSIDYIKLDAAFLAGALKADSRDQRTAKTWAQIQFMINRGFVHAIAKGIESEMQLQTAQAQGIQYAQGFKMAHPQPL